MDHRKRKHDQKESRQMPRKSRKIVPPRLPEELVYQILKRLPVKTLLRFKTVCNEWRTVIEDQEFIIDNTSWSPIVRIEGRLTQDRANNEEKYIRGAYCGGIALEKSLTSGKIRVRNPALGLVLDLPNPNKPISEMNFTFDGQYKLVSLYDDKGVRGCEVLTFNLDHLSWVVSPSFLREKVEIVKNTHINGAVHYFWKDKSDSRRVKIGFDSFDVKSGIFVSSILHEEFFTRHCHWEDVHAVHWRGRPAVYTIAKAKLHVLVLEDYKKQEWGGRIKIYPLTFLEDDTVKEHDKYYGLFLVDRPLFTNVMDFKWNGVMLGYDKKLKKITGMEEGGGDYARYSLVTFKGMRPVVGARVLSDDDDDDDDDDGDGDGDDDDDDEITEMVTDVSGGVEVDPTLLRNHDRVEIMSGVHGGATGKFIGVYGGGGVVKFDGTGEVKILEMKVLAKAYRYE